MATVKREHREAAALALSTGPELEDHVSRWIAGEDTAHRVWVDVAQALADTEAATEARARCRAATLESLLRWAASPDRQVWCGDTDSWHALRGQDFLTGETPEELAGLLGIPVAPVAAAETSKSRPTGIDYENQLAAKKAATDFDRAVEALALGKKDSDQHQGSSIADNSSPTPSARSERGGYDQQPETASAGNVAKPHGDPLTAPGETRVTDPDAGRATTGPEHDPPEKKAREYAMLLAESARLNTLGLVDRNRLTERLRAAEAELATERARVKELAEGLRRACGGLPRPRVNLDWHLDELDKVASSQQAAPPPVDQPSEPADAGRLWGINALKYWSTRARELEQSLQTERAYKNGAKAKLEVAETKNAYLLAGLEKIRDAIPSGGTIEHHPAEIAELREERDAAQAELATEHDLLTQEAAKRSLVKAELLEAQALLMRFAGAPTAADAPWDEVEDWAKRVQPVLSEEASPNPDDAPYDQWIAANPEAKHLFDLAHGWGDGNLFAEVKAKPEFVAAALRRMRSNADHYLDELGALIDDQDYSEIFHHIGHIEFDVKSMDRLARAHARVLRGEPAPTDAERAVEAMTDPAHLRSEYAKVERLWKQATVEREHLREAALLLRAEGTTTSDPQRHRDWIRRDTERAVANFAEAANLYTPKPGECICWKCLAGKNVAMMVLCPTCGNKRCPKASDHEFRCSDSNATDQVGVREDWIPSVGDDVGYPGVMITRYTVLEVDGNRIKIDNHKGSEDLWVTIAEVAPFQKSSGRGDADSGTQSELGDPTVTGDVSPVVTGTGSLRAEKHAEFEQLAAKVGAPEVTVLATTAELWENVRCPDCRFIGTFGEPHACEPLPQNSGADASAPVAQTISPAEPVTNGDAPEAQGSAGAGVEGELKHHCVERPDREVVYCEACDAQYDAEMHKPATRAEFVAAGSDNPGSPKNYCPKCDKCMVPLNGYCNCGERLAEEPEEHRERYQPAKSPLPGDLGPVDAFWAELIRALRHVNLNSTDQFAHLLARVADQLERGKEKR